MPIVYQCITGNWLHNSKKIFHSLDEAKEHIKKIIDMKPGWVSKFEALSSVRITAIDTALLPEYKRIFKEKEAIVPPRKPQINRNLEKWPNKPQDRKPDVEATNIQPEQNKSIVDEIKGQK